MICGGVVGFHYVGRSVSFQAAEAIQFTSVGSKGEMGAGAGRGQVRYPLFFGCVITPRVKFVRYVACKIAINYPRSQTNLALGYAVAPIGPRYDICERDWDFDTEVGWEHTLRYSRILGILERIPMDYLGPERDTLPDRFFMEPIVGSKRAGDVLDDPALVSRSQHFTR